MLYMYSEYMHSTAPLAAAGSATALHRRRVLDVVLHEPPDAVRLVHQEDHVAGARVRAGDLVAGAHRHKLVLLARHHLRSARSGRWLMWADGGRVNTLVCSRASQTLYTLGPLLAVYGRALGP